MTFLFWKKITDTFEQGCQGETWDKYFCFNLELNECCKNVNLLSCKKHITWLILRTVKIYANPILTRQVCKIVETRFEFQIWRKNGPYPCPFYMRCAILHYEIVISLSHTGELHSTCSMDMVIEQEKGEKKCAVC